MIKDQNIQAFFALIRAGLWGDLKFKVESLKLKDFQSLDWNEVYQLAQEQSVQGLVLQGIEWFKNHNLNVLETSGTSERARADLDLNIPQILLLQWIGEVQVIEQRNKEMNAFIAELIEELRKNDIYALLVKGQGVAQCYEKPFWRCSGDVDLLLSNDNYQKAKRVLIPISNEVENEDKITKHQALVMNGFDVELHGRMPFSMLKCVDDGIDEVLNDLFSRGNVRIWNCNGTQVFLPSPDNDVILIFTHFLHHFLLRELD